MITTVLSLVAMPGKQLELVSLMKRVVPAWENATGCRARVVKTFGGNASEFAWVVDYDSVAQWDDARTGLAAHPDYGALLKQLEPLYVPGSAREHLWRTV